MAAFGFAIFKALGSPTRLRIMKRLRKGHMTLSDLSAFLEMRPSSMKEHLDVLADAGLITREDNGRKWKYYSLTPTGAGIVDAGEIRVLLPALSGFVLLWMSARGRLGGKTVADSYSLTEDMSVVTVQSVDVASTPPGIAAEQAALQSHALLFAAAGIILLCVSILMWLGLRKKNRLLKRTPFLAKRSF